MGWDKSAASEGEGCLARHVCGRTSHPSGMGATLTTPIEAGETVDRTGRAAAAANGGEGVPRHDIFAKERQAPYGSMPVGMQGCWGQPSKGDIGALPE